MGLPNRAKRFLPSNKNQASHTRLKHSRSALMNPHLLSLPVDKSHESARPLPIFWLWMLGPAVNRFTCVA